MMTTNIGVVAMKRPITKDDYWYNKIANAEPNKIYRCCPRCGMKVGIPDYYLRKYCYMCGETIYVDEEKNEEIRKKYAFMRKLAQKGVKLNVKKTARRKKMEKDI